MKSMGKADLLSCRLVCKAWSSVVNSVVLKIRVDLSCDSRWSTRLKRLCHGIFSSSTTMKQASMKESSKQLTRFPLLTKLVLVHQQRGGRLSGQPDRERALLEYCEANMLRLQQLTSLNLCGWALREVPPAILALTRLSNLDLSDNALGDAAAAGQVVRGASRTALPVGGLSSLSILANLTCLNLSRCGEYSYSHL